MFCSTTRSKPCTRQLKLSLAIGITANGCRRIGNCCAMGPKRTETGQVPHEQALTLRRAWQGAGTPKLHGCSWWLALSVMSPFFNTHGHIKGALPSNRYEAFLVRHDTYDRGSTCVPFIFSEVLPVAVTRLERTISITVAEI